LLPTATRDRRGPATAGRGGEADERRQSRLPIRDPAGPCRAGARARDERPGRPDLPDHVLHVRRRRPRGAPLRAPAVREHLHADHEPDHRRLREADRRARGRRRRARHRERPGRAVPRALHDPAERGQTSSPRATSMAGPTTSSRSPSRGSASARSSSRGTTRRTSPRPSTRALARSTSRRSATPASTCPTSRPWPRSPTTTGSRWWWTTPSGPPATPPAPSTSAPTSSSPRRPSGSGATAPRSAA